MNEKNIELRFRPRASGKTTEIIRLMKEALTKGEKIAYIGKHKESLQQIVKVLTPVTKGIDGTAQIRTYKNVKDGSFKGLHPDRVFADDVEIEDFELLSQLLNETNEIIGYGTLTHVTNKFTMLKNTNQFLAVDLKEQKELVNYYVIEAVDAQKRADAFEKRFLNSNIENAHLKKEIFELNEKLRNGNVKHE